MKKLFVFFLALMLAFGCVSTMPQYVRTPQQQAQINDAIVALVNPTPSPTTGLLRVYCSGAFVDRYVVLTAAHCVHGMVEDVSVVTYRDYTHTNHSISSETRLSRFAVRRLDASVDLALLVALDDDLTPHNVLQVAEQTPTQGEYVILMGNPRGLPWSLTQGVVSNNHRTGWAGHPTSRDSLFIQHDAPASPGSSGGVLLNHQNQIIGVLIRGYHQENHLSMSVHTSLVNVFLYGAVR